MNFKKNKFLIIKKTLSKELAKLPRITREFYAFLLERRDENSLDTSSSKFFYRFRMLNKIKLHLIINYFHFPSNHLNLLIPFIILYTY